MRLRQALPPPLPPAWLPEGRTIVLDGTGEVFYRDSGPTTAGAGTLLLLHGWTVTADLNWALAYQPLVEAGYRVIAIDHRGHGRGLRPQARFRLSDCAADAAQLAVKLEAGPVTLVGYSMGGAIAQLIARDHPSIADGLVLCATSLHWSGTRERTIWAAMQGFQWTLRTFPHRFYRGLLRRAGSTDANLNAWMLGEFSRGSADDIAEAGRELGRFDSRPWIASLRLPVSVVIPDADQLIPPARQRETVAAIPGAVGYQVEGDHGDVMVRHSLMIDAILLAIADVRRRRVSPQNPSSPALYPGD